MNEKIEELKKSAAEFGRPEWKAEYEAGYRYYVLKYNLFDGRRVASFYKHPREAQEAFEKMRDPLGKHS